MARCGDRSCRENRLPRSCRSSPWPMGLLDGAALLPRPSTEASSLSIRAICSSSSIARPLQFAASFNFSAACRSAWQARIWTCSSFARVPASCLRSGPLRACRSFSSRESLSPGSTSGGITVFSGTAFPCDFALNLWAARTLSFRLL